MKTITISVRRAHILYGVRRDPWQCPLGIAIRGAVRAQRNGAVSVGQKWVEWENEIGRNFRARLPFRAALFVHRFDEGLEVKPFKFKLKYS